jgi:polar amino acid transport system substrate-binding protein
LINRSGDVAALTASDYAPFTEVAFPNRGMLTEIVNLAFEEISEHDLDIYWVDDWSAHLSTLMIERRAFDIGFPWYRPDCSRLDLLDSDSRLRCEYFNFSDALYTTVVSFFVRAGSDITLNNVPDFRGLELCRPDGYFTFDLTQRGIIDLPPDRDGMVAVFHQPDTLADCFRMLDDGRVDVVSVNTTTARAPLREIGMEDRVEVRDTMAETLSLHIVVPKALPNGEVLMLRINRALRALEADGTLDQVRRSALEFFYTN